MMGERRVMQETLFYGFSLPGVLVAAKAQIFAPVWETSGESR